MWGFDRSHPDESTPRDALRPAGHGAHPGDDAAIPDELIDALLDGEDGSFDESAFRAAFRRDEQAQARLDSTQRALDALRATPSGRDDAPVPDLTASILGEVDRRRGLFGVRGLRLVAVARIAIAAAVLLAGIGLFVAHRMAPETVTLTPRVTPISDVVRSVPAESADAVSTFRTAADSLREAITQPVERAKRSAPCPKSWQCALHASVNRNREVTFPVAPGAWTVTQLSPEAVWIESIDHTGAKRVTIFRSGSGQVLTGRLAGSSGTLRFHPVTAVPCPEPALADRGVVFSDR